MNVLIHIWKGEMPRMAVFNAIYATGVGHASISIIKNEKDFVYISHRPKSLTTGITDRDDSKKYVLKDYAPKASPISFKEDCEIRKREPDIVIKISGEYLNISRMLLYYEKYLKNHLPKSECYYHVIHNNCCSVVYNFIRQGLNCKNLEKKCYKCEKTKVQNGHQRDLYATGLIILAGYLVGWFTSLIPTSIISLIYLVLAILGLLFVLIPLTNLEKSIVPIWRRRANFWSPITLENFINKIKKELEMNKLSSCPRKPILGFLNHFDWDLLRL